MATSITSTVNKKVVIKGIQQIIAFNWHQVGEKYNEKSYTKKQDMVLTDNPNICGIVYSK